MFLQTTAGNLYPDAVTRYGIQSRLQRLETASGPDRQFEGGEDEERTQLNPEQQVRLAGLLDRFDDLGEDARLELLASLVRRARRDGRPCVVVVDSLKELAYVVTYLYDSVGSPVAELTSRLPAEAVPSVREKLATGGTVVASAGFIENGEELPDHTINIWWNAPRTRTSAEARLGVGFTTTDINVFALVPDPPLIDDAQPIRDLVAMLTPAERRRS